MTSRRVGLTAAFIALAAGGAAACDRPADDEAFYDSGSDMGDFVAEDPTPSATSARPVRTSATPWRKPSAAPTTTPPPAEAVFYCADEEGYVAEDWYCDDEDPEYDPSAYFLYYSRSYGHAWAPGDVLPGGSRIRLDDTRARTKLGLPATGFVGNGSVKTNIVGRSSGSSGDAGFSSGG